MLKLLRITGFMEGISYLVLLGIAMPLKYALDIKSPTWFVGMAHGVLFVGYVMLVLVVAMQKKWKISIIFWALLASLLPFATFIADKKIFSRADDPEMKRA
jgi:integral membrane protein